MIGLSLEDFHDQYKCYVKRFQSVGRRDSKIFSFEPATGAVIFEIGFLIHEIGPDRDITRAISSDIVLAIARDIGDGWIEDLKLGFLHSCNCAVSSFSGPSEGPIPNGYGNKSLGEIETLGFDKGDTCFLIVDKTRGTIHLRKDYGKKVLMCENVIFGASVNFYCIVNNGSDVQFIKYREYLPPIEPKKEIQESKERIRRILDDPTVFNQIVTIVTIKIDGSQPKQIRTFQCFDKSHSKLNEEKVVKTITITSSHFDNLPVDCFDEELITFILLMGDHSLIPEIPISSLPYYYHFFRELGLKRGVEVILKKIKSVKDLEVCTRMFIEFCKKFEREDIKKWLEGGNNGEENAVFPKGLNRDDFEFEFSYRCLEKIKNLDKGVELFNKLFPQIVTLLENFKVGEQRVEETEKNELSLIESTTTESVNCILRSRDGKEFPCHRELLASKFNFFSRMFHFEGKEREELIRLGQVQLIHLDSTLVSLLFDFVYHQKVTTSKLEEILSVMIHADMHQEDRLLCFYLEHLLKLPCRDDLKDMIVKQGLCDRIYPNERLKKYVLPILRIIDPSLGNEDKILLMMDKSIQKAKKKKKKRELFQKLGEMENRIREGFERSFESRFEDLEKKLEESDKAREKEIQELKKMIVQLTILSKGGSQKNE